jgi:D-serine deaminase-like pyridoxal phosphate-dependent protein
VTMELMDSLLDQPRFRGVLTHLGEAGSRQLIATPALLCDVDMLQSNVHKMAERVASSALTLRPHVKSHKSAYVAALQLNAGAVGLAFAKLSEAEVIVDRLLASGRSGELSVLITSPLVGGELVDRALVLSQRCELLVVADDPEGVRELGARVGDTDRTIGVLCDVDVGLGRTGVTSAGEALRVVDVVAQFSGLRFAGVQGYGGHLQHLSGRDRRIAATAESTERLRIIIDALEAEGHRVGIRTGGGTGTSSIDIELGCLNELQCGSYVFMDREYRDALGTDLEGRFDQSLTIATTVISTNHTDFVTLDAGLKAMATDAGAPLLVGSDDPTRYQYFGDEQGLLVRSPGESLERGDRVELIPPHCDPTVDRYDFMWLVRNDTVVDVARVDARGCSQ